MKQTQARQSTRQLDKQQLKYTEPHEHPDDERWDRRPHPHLGLERKRRPSHTRPQRTDE